MVRVITTESEFKLTPNAFSLLQLSGGKNIPTLVNVSSDPRNSSRVNQAEDETAGRILLQGAAGGQGLELRVGLRAWIHKVGNPKLEMGERGTKRKKTNMALLGAPVKANIGQLPFEWFGLAGIRSTTRNQP